MEKNNFNSRSRKSSSKSSDNQFADNSAPHGSRPDENVFDTSSELNSLFAHDPALIDRVVEMSEALGDNPITRRTLLKLAALGGSVLLVNTVIPKTAITACDNPLGSCSWPTETTTSGPSFSASVLRKQDMLILRFDFYFLRLNGTNLERTNAERDAYIVVNFAHDNDFLPQNIAEQAFLETAEEFKDDTEDPSNVPNPPGGSETPNQPGSVAARLAGESRLVFKIPPGTSPIPFTMDELLAWQKYELSVAPTALPADEPDYGKMPAEPRWNETALEVPWQLIVSPNRHAGWAHATSPVTHQNRTELWHTRLGVRKLAFSTGGLANWIVNEKWSTYRTLRAIWTPGFDREVTPDANDMSPFRMSLTNNDRWQLVRLTSDYNMVTAGTLQYYNPAPVEVERFMLSSLGAWMNTRGAWPNAPAGEDLDIIEWRHLATMARDHYVRVVYKGYLFPTGHAATLVKVTERKIQAVPFPPVIAHIDSLAGQPAAYLRQRFFIVVRQPVKTYPAHSSQPNQGRQWPFNSVRITTLVTPSLDDPTMTGEAYDLAGQGQKAFWPRVNGRDYLFHMVATDSDGQTTEFTSPLAFISSTLQQVEDIASFLQPAVTSYNSSAANLNRRQRSLMGQKVAFAPSSAADGAADGKRGDTSAEVKMITLGATLPNPSNTALPDDQPRFFPIWQEAEVRLPGAEQASGKALPAPVVIELHPDYIAQGFQPSANPAYIWAKLKDKVDLDFNGSGDKSGAVVTPNMLISGLSRNKGVMSGPIDTIPTNFDPNQFFNGAKILGGILLAEIIGAANLGDGRKTPRITNNVVYPGGDNSLPPQAVETLLDWNPDLKGDPLHIFEPSSSTSMEVKGVFITPIDPPAAPTYNITGDLRNFWVNMIGDGSCLFLRFHFSKIVFTASTGKKPDVDVDIDKTEFAGQLEFVNPLKDFMSKLGSGFNLDITPTQVSAGLSLPIPSVAVGIVSIQNISLGFKLCVPFTGEPVRVRFNFCERDNPFLLTVFAIGGGGYFAIEVGLDGVERLEAALEFGASMALDLVVASGKVYIMGGIYFEMEKVGQPDETISLTAYIRMGGSLKILGLITLSVEFYLGLSYQKPPNELWGQAKLTVKVEVLFFSASVELSVERRIAGGDSGGGSHPPAASGIREGYNAKLKAPHGGGNFEDLMNEDEWVEYTDAFAQVV
ncbi:MAG: hypothetical protein GX226_00410 [Dehalococcoidales bacterium]|nr:hypothetical protein [Dehalococcoidales bacterium]